MAKKRSAKKRKTLTITPPRTKLELADYGQRMGTLMRSIDAREQRVAGMKERIDAINAEAVTPMWDEVVALAKAVRVYAEEHRRELTEDDKLKIVTVLDALTIRWYETPPSIKIGKADVDAAIAWLVANRRLKFVRKKLELNKEALGEDLAFAQTVPGVAVETQLKFSVKPRKRDDWMECNLRTNRWKHSVPSAKEPMSAGSE